VDGSDVVARAYCLPFAMGTDIGRPVLPDDGWDGVIRWSYLDGLVQRLPTTVSALEISIDPGHRGSGLAQEMISAMMDLVATRGFDRLVVPVRPSRKHVEPNTSMLEYAARVRPDGLPEDPWLRLHVRMGGAIVKVCPTAMTIPGTLAEWREWTGLPFAATGPVIVPGALVPVNADVTHDHAVYVEPNVWVEHLVGI
jgi:GNAT superfamily N-acetyltransferase